MCFVIFWKKLNVVLENILWCLNFYVSFGPLWPFAGSHWVYPLILVETGHMLYC